MSKNAKPVHSPGSEPQSMDNQRQLRHIKVTGEFLTGIFTEGNEIRLDVTHGLPADSEFRRIEYVDEYDCYWLIVWSSEFDSVPEGSKIPQIEVEFEEIETVKA